MQTCQVLVSHYLHRVANAQLLIHEDIEYQRNITSAAEPSNSSRFQEFSRLELPRLVRRTLEGIVEHEAQPLEDKLKERLVDIVKQCQTQLETMFQTAAGSSDTSAEATLNLKALPSTSIIERPIDTHPPTMFGDFVSTDLHTKSEAIPPHLHPNEAPQQGGALSETVEPVSDFSDSGYDSISLAPSSAFIIHNELTQEYFDPNQYLDLSDYLHFAEPATDTVVQEAQTHANDNHSTWSFVDSIPDTNNANLDELDCAHDLDLGWQYFSATNASI